MHALRASNDKSNQSVFVDKKLISNKLDSNLVNRFRNQNNTSVDAALFNFEPDNLNQSAFVSTGPKDPNNLFSQDFFNDDPNDNILPKNNTKGKSPKSGAPAGLQR